MSPARKADPDLDGLIDEITVDAYGEDEQLICFENAFDEDAKFPCPGTAVGEQFEVLSVSVKDHRRELTATCKHGGRRYEMRCSTLTFAPTPPPRGLSPRTGASSATEPHRLNSYPQTSVSSTTP